MSVDKSLRLQSGLQRARSVLSRAERLAELTEAGKWDETKSIFGLVKVKVRRVRRRKAAKVEGAEAAAPVAAGAAPVAGAAPAPAAGAAKAAPEKGAAKEKGAPKDKGGKK